MCTTINYLPINARLCTHSPQEEEKVTEGREWISSFLQARMVQQFNHSRSLRLSQSQTRGTAHYPNSGRFRCNHKSPAYLCSRPPLLFDTLPEVHHACSSTYSALCQPDDAYDSEYPSPDPQIGIGTCHHGSCTSTFPDGPY